MTYGHEPRRGGLLEGMEGTGWKGAKVKNGTTVIAQSIKYILKNPAK